MDPWQVDPREWFWYDLAEGARRLGRTGGRTSKDARPWDCPRLIFPETTWGAMVLVWMKLPDTQLQVEQLDMHGLCLDFRLFFFSIKQLPKLTNVNRGKIKEKETNTEKEKKAEKERKKNRDYRNWWLCRRTTMTPPQPLQSCRNSPWQSTTPTHASCPTVAERSLLRMGHLSPPSCIHQLIKYIDFS